VKLMEESYRANGLFEPTNGRCSKDDGEEQTTGGFAGARATRARGRR
jgi:hypothetical protein